MTTYTENYNLGKQTDHADKFDMNIITQNMDIIDNCLKNLDDRISAISGTNSPKNACVSANFLIGEIAEIHEILPDWDVWQEEDDNAKTTATLTARPTKNCLLIVAVMHRGNVEISGENWEKIAVSQVADSGNLNQKITVWTKKISAGNYEITVNQTTSVRMNMKVICLYQAENLTLIDNVLLENNGFVPSAKTGKKRLYFVSSVYANDNVNTAIITENCELEVLEEKRFCVFFDYEKSTENVPMIKYYDTNYTSNSINVLTFDVEEGEND